MTSTNTIATSAPQALSELEKQVGAAMSGSSTQAGVELNSSAAEELIQQHGSRFTHKFGETEVECSFIGDKNHYLVATIVA